MTRHWHYTNGRHITDIMADGVIKPADDGSGASPLVWLSSNPLWENAAARYLKSPVTGGCLLVLNADQMAVFCDGIFRIAVDADLFPLHAWTGDLIERAGISDRTVGKHLAGANLTDSEPTQWAGSLKPIPCEFWNGIDYWRDGVWIALTDEDIVPTRRAALEAGISHSPRHSATGGNVLPSGAQRLGTIGNAVLRMADGPLYRVGVGKICHIDPERPWLPATARVTKFW